MYEKELRLRVSKSVSIYGRLNGSLKKPLVIIVHGLPGHIQEGLYEKAALWFARHGYSSFRFNLYSWQKHARQLVDCTLKTHAADLDFVVHHFRKLGVKKIFVAGHSYGGPTILLSRDQDFNGVSLWDPSYEISFIKKKYGFPGGEYVRQLDGYFMGHWGVNVVIGKKMVEEAETLKWDSLTKTFSPPLQIIAAEKGVLIPGTKQYFATANKPKDYVLMQRASHYFDDAAGLQEKLFRTTKRWFDTF